MDDVYGMEGGSSGGSRFYTRTGSWTTLFDMEDLFGTRRMESVCRCVAGEFSSLGETQDLLTSLYLLSRHCDGGLTFPMPPTLN
jgi:hypothetical protein